MVPSVGEMSVNGPEILGLRVGSDRCRGSKHSSGTGSGNRGGAGSVIPKIPLQESGAEVSGAAA